MIQDFDLRPVGAVAEDVLGRRPSPAAQWRWIHRGVAGGTVRLTARRHAGRWHCTRQDFEAFVDAQTRAALGPDASAPEIDGPRSARMERDLASAGLL